jgi:Mg2+-importing ATPase
MTTFTIPFLGALTSVFGFVPVSASHMGAVAAIVAGYIVTTEVAKGWFFRLETSSSGVNSGRLAPKP